MKKLIFALLLVCSSCAPGCMEGEHWDCKTKTCMKDVVDKPTEKPAVIVTPPVKIKVQVEPEIPKYTKFKVSDKVCINGRWTGVVTDIEWGSVPAGHDPVLLYTVEYWDGEEAVSGEKYYDTELELGKC